MIEIDREKLKRTFDKDAELYDRARPEYPEQIFEDLFAIGGLAHDAAVLEVRMRHRPRDAPRSAG